MIRHSGAIIAAASIIFVAGCNRGAANNSANKAAPTNTANAAAPAPAPAAPAAPAAGAPVDAAFLTAQPWGPNGMCAEATKFNADGTLTDNDGPGTWTLQGNTLTVTQRGRPQPATVSRNGSNLVAANPANPAESMTLSPCPAGSGGSGGAAAGETEGEEGAEGETE
jgi:hypothetical protein